MKKIIRITLITFFFFQTGFVSAVEPGAKANIKQEKKEKVLKLKDEIRSTTSQIKQNLKEKNMGTIERLKDKIKTLIAQRIHGILKSITPTALVVTTDKGEYTVNVTSGTILKRRFGGTSNISEFRQGDELAVVAKRRQSTDVTTTEKELDAKYIRNLSIQRRNTVFLGNVTSKTDTSLTVQTANRGVQTVYLSSTTSITEKDKTIVIDNLNVGDKVLVKGELWDRANTKINAKKIMKLPLSPKATKSLLEK